MRHAGEKSEKSNAKSKLVLARGTGRTCVLIGTALAEYRGGNSQSEHYKQGRPCHRVGEEKEIPDREFSHLVGVRSSAGGVHS